MGAQATKNDLGELEDKLEGHHTTTNTVLAGLYDAMQKLIASHKELTHRTTIDTEWRKSLNEQLKEREVGIKRLMAEIERLTRQNVEYKKEIGNYLSALHGANAKEESDKAYSSDLNAQLNDMDNKIVLMERQVNELQTANDAINALHIQYKHNTLIDKDAEENQRKILEEKIDQLKQNLQALIKKKKKPPARRSPWRQVGNAIKASKAFGRRADGELPELHITF